jgi:acetyl-CoA carboxylase biotin carboxyl carrier protein
MASVSSNQDVFDVRKIRRLVELMKEHDLSEMDLQQGEMRVQLRRREPPIGPVADAASVVAVAPPPPVAQPAAEVAKPAEAKSDGASGSEHVTVVRSPMVGTFYAAPDPDSPPYVKVGDHVGPDTTVCIVEAMKVFNQIPAEISGKVVSVLVENGEPVEYGQPVLKVDTRG